MQNHSFGGKKYRIGSDKLVFGKGQESKIEILVCLCVLFYTLLLPCRVHYVLATTTRPAEEYYKSQSINPRSIHRSNTVHQDTE